MHVNDFILPIRNSRCWELNTSSAISVELNSVEVIPFALIEVRQVPENTNILQTEIVPLIAIRIIRYFIVVDSLAREVASSNFNKFFRVYFLRSGTLISISSWDPSSINDKGSSIDFDCVFLFKSGLHTQLTAFVTEKRVNHVESVTLLPINNLLTRNEYFLACVELSNNIIRFEHVVNGPLCFGHSPPSEVHLCPRSAIHHGQRHFVVCV